MRTVRIYALHLDEFYINILPGCYVGSTNALTWLDRGLALYDSKALRLL